MKSGEVAVSHFLLALCVDTGLSRKLWLPSAVATWSDYRRNSLSAGHRCQASTSTARAAPFCGCFCSSYKMVDWRGQDSWPSFLPEGKARQLLPSPFSFRPTSREAEPGKRAVLVPAVPPGRAEGW